MNEETWWPSLEEYNPNISKQKWTELLKDEKVFTFNSLCMMKRFLHHNGEASCIELANKYGRTYSAYISFSFWLASRIHDKTNCAMPPEREENARFWPILYVGRSVSKSDVHEGTYVWKLRPELKLALEEMNILNDEKYPLFDKKHDWKTLLAEYKKLLQNEDTRKIAFDDEEYKWKTISDCKDLKGKEVLSYLTDANSNLFDHFALGEAKQLLAKNDFNKIYEELINDNIDLNERLSRFKNSILEAYSETDKNRLIKDERSASVFLTCHNSEKYTFYKDSYYTSLCKYLEISSETAGNKYSHYLTLINDFEKAVVSDSTIMDFYKTHTENYEQSTKLIAQNIIYVLFESGSKFVTLNKNFWLLTWNKDNWGWEKYDEWCVGTKNGNTYSESWRCSSKQPSVGDHFFLMKTGGEPRGIVAHGYITNVSYEAPHYDYEKAQQGGMASYVGIEFDLIQNYKTEPILAIETLKSQFPDQNWSPQGSGIQIKCDINKLLKLWSETIGEYEMSDKIEECKQLLLNTHNLILHGAPGTGKTRLAKKIAESMGAEWEMVQFHPSYDYTDFVEGLRPVKNVNDGQIGFERKDGVFKKFCEKALKNRKDSNPSVKEKIIEFIQTKKSFVLKFYGTNYVYEFYSVSGDDIKFRIYKEEFPDEIPPISSLTVNLNLFERYLRNEYISQDEFARYNDENSFTEDYYKNLADYISNESEIKNMVFEDSPSSQLFVFIIDEINRGEMSKIFGELFFAIEPSYRGARECANLRTQYANLQESPNIFDSVLGKKEEFGHFFIPENVYIIGTMNDIDRSVESMDFAFRRRFTFKEIKANENLGMLDELNESIREKARQTLLGLNKAIWDEDTKSGIEGLSSAYHIGGAYFLKLKELGGDFDKLWEYHLEGLLREYLRGMEDAESNLEKLHLAYKNGQEV